ncbi:MAG TPA: FKBP-type peptidyl-prolyl cis-trans isomerase [Gemmatimonadaceae bacterium]|nr:FKBP-type peptidyl-prolyl cis-trans isomerase [Gemmatimonadaceae bacterium]
MRLRRLAAALLPLAFAACLEGTDYSTNAFPNIPIEQTTFAAGLNVNLAASTKTATGLYYRDVAVGTGATATSTSRVSVYYAGYLANGTLFDSQTSPSAPYGPIQLGAGTFIKGWEEGMVGMKVGGTRQLIIPPSLGYGATGNNAIPPNAVLVFTIQLVAVQ